jgi:hypothetical protein
MRSQVRRYSACYGGSRLPALLVLLTLAGGCVLAYRHFFQRQGEAAVSLIPADATAVVTLDLKPSPQQVPTFERIQSAQQRENLGGQLDSLLSKAFSNSPIGSHLRPYVTTSLAFATFKPAAGHRPDDSEGVGLFAMSDPERARDVLAREAQKTTVNGQDYYRVNAGDRAVMAIIGDYLVAGSSIETVERIVGVHNGATPSILTSPDYRAARATLPADSNLMLFVPPDGLRQAAATLPGFTANSQGSNPIWLALGAAIRPAGIEMSIQAPYQTPAGVAPIQVAPLDPHLLSRVPSGAYGLIALSQPDQYWNYFINNSSHVAPLLGGNADTTTRQVNEGIANFERETGISVSQDVLPAFHGNALLAVYQPEPGQTIPDGLILLDDANNANPAALADKVRAYVERASARQGQNPVRLFSQSVNGATVWSLDADTERQLHNTTTAPFNGGAPGDPGTQISNSMAHKTLVYAQVGHALLIASTRSLLDRAIAAYTHGSGSLAADPVYAAMAQQIPSGSQSLLLVDLPTIMEAIRPTLTNSMSGNQSGVTPDDILHLFGQHTGIIGAQQYDGRAIKGYYYMPLDYDRLIHIIGVAQRASGANTANSTPFTATPRIGGVVQ